MPLAAMIGAGLIGRSWAMVFARAGWDVALYDAAPGAADQALGLIGAGLAEQAEYGLARDPQAAAKRVRSARDLPDALDGASFVQENAPETVEAKRADVPRARPAGRARRHPCLLHLGDRRQPLHRGPARPRPLPGRASGQPAAPGADRRALGAPWTAPETIARAKAVYESVGQVPIVVRKEIEGFILNRLQGALLAEAFRLVGEGYVSPQDLDKTLKDGLGLRWSFMGPFETIDLNAPGGMADYCARYTGFYRSLQSAPAGPDVYEPPNVQAILREWGEAPDRTRLDARTRWRDRRLAALRAHKASQPGP